MQNACPLIFLVGRATACQPAATRAELGEELVEALAAEVEGLGVGAVAQPEHAVEHVRKVGALGLQVLVQRARVVGYVALAVSGSADEEHTLTGKNRAIEPVHQEGADLSLAIVEGELHLLLSLIHISEPTRLLSTTYAALRL